MMALCMDFVINTVYRNKQLPLVSDATHISQVPVLKALLFMFQSFCSKANSPPERWFVFDFYQAAQGEGNCSCIKDTNYLRLIEEYI